MHAGVVGFYAHTAERGRPQYSSDEQTRHDASEVSSVCRFQGWVDGSMLQLLLLLMGFALDVYLKQQHLSCT